MHAAGKSEQQQGREQSAQDTVRLLH
jgi:hypothetical protein